MGMHTELVLGVDLVSSTPDYIISAIKYMLSDIDTNEMVGLPDHPLFKTPRWQIMLVCDSAYFGGITCSKMDRESFFGDYELSVRSNMKNYHSEIELFLNLIQPYIEDQGFIGYVRYEEDDTPELIYNTMDCIELIRISEGRWIRTKLDDDWLERYKELYKED